VENPVCNTADVPQPTDAGLMSAVVGSGPAPGPFQLLRGDTPAGALLEVPPCFHQRVQEALGEPVACLPETSSGRAATGLLADALVPWARSLLAALGQSWPEESVRALAAMPVDTARESNIPLEDACEVLELIAIDHFMNEAARAQGGRPWSKQRRRWAAQDRRAARRIATRSTAAVSAAGAGKEATAEAVEHLLEHPVRLRPLADLVDRVQHGGVVPVAEQAADVLEGHVRVVAQQEHGDLAR
jgi:hypothetical protein